MKRVNWSTPASRDFRKLYLYLAKIDTDVVDRIGSAIIAKADWLAEYPMLGATHPGNRRKSNVAGTRYLLIYRVEPYGIELLRIMHESQNWR